MKILTTGGTIDKIYFDANSEFQVGDSPLHECLLEANVTFDYSIESVLKKDSLEITEADRQQLRQKVAEATESRILVTHGTDTMVDTAVALAGIAGKTIVLTGAMQPARLRFTDAIFNIGYAVATLQLLGEGVYIAMNGQVFDPANVRKNLAGQRFEPVRPG
ncbi:asparaginase [Exilibacterium tricleocarpae]|uniref:Asparaginase n=1 Tax=Exilibacterium tricleocarpae TaxID=2591008 RepID=A0A545SZ29_9GAMM|nr:asparaginase [Exilibacterium tricleocarpae]